MDLATAQAAMIDAIKGQAQSLILGQWPDYAQRNAALGLYDGLAGTDPYLPANMKAGISAIIAAVHAAEAVINAMTDPAAVLAYVAPLPPVWAPS